MHPANVETYGIDVSTGPFVGIGISNAVGIHANRFLAADAVNKLNHGYHCATMGQPPIGYVLWACGTTVPMTPSGVTYVTKDISTTMAVKL